MAKSFGRRDDEEQEDSSWLDTYADAITLLMAFFVLLYAMSDVDKAKFETMTLSIRQVLAGELSSSENVSASKPRELTEGLRQSLASELQEGLARDDRAGALRIDLAGHLDQDAANSLTRDDGLANHAGGPAL